MLICLDMRTGAGCGTQTVDEASFCEDCGQNLHFALRLHNSNTFVERYRILQVIGYGGFGAVYKALTPSRKRVALKETFDLSSISTFKREFAVLSRLSHVNLPRYIDMFEAGGHGYLVMEYVPGQSLQDILDEQAAQVPSERLPESQVLGYAIQLCDVLHYLHSQQPPILHRDVKPANIRLTPEGRIKLVDFGLLKQGGQQTRATIRGLGTSGYAPIEQYADNQQGTNPRSDIYALGATLYHLLSGNEPLSAPTRITGTPDPLPTLHQVRPDVSAHVANVIRKAMNLLPKDRFATTQELKQALLGGHIASGDELERDELERDKLLASWVSLKRLNPKTTEGVATNGSKKAELLPHNSQRAVIARQQEALFAPPTSLEEVKGWLKKAFFPDSNTHSTNASHNVRPAAPTSPYFVPAPHKMSLPHLVTQTQEKLLGLAYTALGDKLVGMSSRGTLYEWQVSDGRLTQTHLLPHLKRVNNFAYSSNGQTLATISDDHKVRIWNTQTRELIHQLEMPQSRRKNRLQYSPDGNVLIVIIRNKYFLKAWQVSDGKNLYTREYFSRQTYSMTFSPNSTMFAIGRGADFDKVHIRRTLDGKLLGKMLRPSAAYSLAWHPKGKVLATGDYGKIKIWRLKSGQLLQKIVTDTRPPSDTEPPYLKPITHLLWHPSGKFIISASEDQGVCVWRSPELFLKYKLNAHLGNVTALAIAPDGRTLAVAGKDKNIRFWLFPEHYKFKVTTQPPRLDELMPTANVPETAVHEERNH